MTRRVDYEDAGEMIAAAHRLPDDDQRAITRVAAGASRNHMIAPCRKRVTCCADVPTSLTGLSPSDRVVRLHGRIAGKPCRQIRIQT